MANLAKELNERHAAAKEAERASVALYSLVYFRDKPVVESAYATSVRANGLSVLVPRFGIEGWAHLFDLNAPSPFKWLADEGAITAPDGSPEGLKIRAMDPVTVRISVDTTRTHPRLAMELVDAASERPLAEVLLERAGPTPTPPQR